MNLEEKRRAPPALVREIDPPGDRRRDAKNCEPGKTFRIETMKEKE
jgi:hypothetical protein